MIATSLLVATLGCGDTASQPPPARGLDAAAAGPDATAAGPDAAPVDPGDLLAAGSWTCLEGAHAQGSTLVIDPIDRWIVGYAPAPRTPNPPIMLVGPHLELGGDGFSVSARLSVAAPSPALLTLNGKLPVIYDEWRQEGVALAFGLEAGRVLVRVWDGTRATPTTSRFADGLSGTVTIGVAVADAEAVVTVDGAEVGRAAVPARLASGRVYFGAMVAPDNQLTVHALAASGDGLTVITPAQFMATPASATSLRARAAPRALAIGTAVASYPLLGESAYATTLGREFSMVTPENMMKFQFIHPRRDRYAFCDADALVAYAAANGMKVHGHALVWGEAVPQWVSQGNFSSAELTEILHQHITTVVSRYRGRIAEWDVLNEPLDDDTGKLRATVWQRALGTAYVATVFRWAHEADPDARLYVNEYGIESAGSKADKLFALVQAAVQAGVPIHGVGFQGHEDLGEEADPAELRASMARYQSLGIDVRISELDDNPGHRPSAAELAEQAAFYRAELDVCLALPHCISFSTWGFTDRYSSLANDGAYDDLGFGLIFDEDYAPKPAYDALAAGLMP